MQKFDASQQSVLNLDPRNHARVLGAPGSGKSMLVVESYARVSEAPGFSDADLLILAPNRLAASRLREQLENRLARVIGGTPVRTLASLAFAILGRTAATCGHEPPRLLTGTVQDEILAHAVSALQIEGTVFSLAPEVLLSDRFRAELREFWRVLDDFNMTPTEIAERLRGASQESQEGPYSRAPEQSIVDRWLDAAHIIDRAQQTLASDRPHELSSSAMLRTAVAALYEAALSDSARGNDTVARSTVPKLILIDDAQQLGEGELALIAACASLGSSVWVFGDPDIAAGAFQGEHSAVLTKLTVELERRGARSMAAEDAVVLTTVYRHGSVIRQAVSALTARIGAAGAGEQRQTEEQSSGEAGDRGTVRFARTASSSEQIGSLAYQLRARRLGLDQSEELPWRQMAVICRSRAEVTRISRLLAERQVPTGEMAGGLVLREHRIVRDLVMMLQHALQLQPLTAMSIVELLSGPLGALDQIGVRRLRGSLLVEERRRARAELREPLRIDDIILEAVHFPGDIALIDSAGGRALRKLGLIAQSGQRIAVAQGSYRETLWAIWDATGLAERLQEEALGNLGVKSESAHRALDAVLALFFRLQRHEENGSEQPIAQLLDEVLMSSIAEDTLAGRSARDEVIVTTPQGAIGHEFELVCVVGIQDGIWPNLRSQGSLLGALMLERWLLGGEARETARAETLHDELRLFALACSRARTDLLVLSIHDDDNHPGPFFVLGKDYENDAPLPSERLSLRGAVAEMRRRLTQDEADEQARVTLITLAQQHVEGADPDEWYGVMPPSSIAPLVDLDGDPNALVTLSPSQLETAEECPLSWVIGRLGGGDRSFTADLGTLLHHVLETAETNDPEEIFASVRREWTKLEFSAEWESERTLELARVMVEGVSSYLRQFDSSGGRLLAKEAGFGVQVSRALLQGKADRLELVSTSERRESLSILDLKTGRTLPTKAELAQHAQLQAYQLGLIGGSFTLHSANESSATATEESSSATTRADPVTRALSEDYENAGARLLYVHPEATKGSGFLELSQAPLDDEDREAFVERIGAVARIMAGASFTARIEHHCTSQFRSGNCSVHIVPEVSHL